MHATDFLARFWQKRPLLIRKAMPDAGNVIDRTELFRLAAHADVESRLVWRGVGRNSRWHLAHGPLSASRLRGMPARDWTVLVQGVNLHVPAADRLLRHFSFIPHARLDDLMVSYAATGGGVGPHMDSYDVFLIQASGNRIWRIGRPRGPEARTLVENAPLKILRHFKPEDEYLLEPGDLLYLPPGWAHEGTAATAGMTLSVGFRAPAQGELLSEFLQRHAEQLADRADLRALYADPRLRLQSHPAAIPPGMIAATQALLDKLTFSRADIAGFLGQYLSEPKARVIFERPRPALSLARFTNALAGAGARLDARTIMLFNGSKFFVNGEPVAAAPTVRAALTVLADSRGLPAGRRSAALCELLHGWYVAGWLHPRQH